MLLLSMWYTRQNLFTGKPNVMFGPGTVLLGILGVYGRPQLTRVPCPALFAPFLELSSLVYIEETQ